MHDEAVHDEALHDEAAHDQAVLDESVLDEAVLDEAMLGEAVLDRAKRDEGTRDEEGHERAMRERASDQAAIRDTIRREDAGPVVAMAMAMDRNRLIGQAGGLPWHVPGELAHFKAVTMGKPIVMGRRTFESIGRPLPGRTNIVVTRDRQWSGDGVVVTHSLEDALATGREVAMAGETRAEEVVVIGGAALCKEAMAMTERLYLTVIDHAFEGDTWLDSFRESDWFEVSREEPDPTMTGDYRIAFRVLERRPVSEPG